MDLLRTLNLFKRLNLRNVELGVWEKWDKSCLDLLKRNNFNLVIHHYFPPPKKPFIINLASQNKEILKKSIHQIKKSIDFCCNLNIGLFSFHAGFRIDPNINLKFDFKKDNILNYESSYKVFKELIKIITEYAEQKNVKIAIENNVITKDNLINGGNTIFLMVEAWEFERLFKEVPSKNLGALLDLGHLKVSSNSLNFDKYKFIEKLKNKVFEIHLHENNGIIDQHLGLKKNSWCLKAINKYFRNKKIPLIIESKYSDIKELINNKNLIEKSFKNE